MPRWTSKANFHNPAGRAEDAHDALATEEDSQGTTPEIAVTKEMIRAYADLTGDHTPVHVDEAFAKASHFGGIVAHGLFGLSLADGLKTQGTLQFPPGASLGWNWDFLKPIRAGDRLHVKYRIGAMRPTRKAGWGILNHHTLLRRYSEHPGGKQVSLR